MLFGTFEMFLSHQSTTSDLGISIYFQDPEPSMTDLKWNKTDVLNSYFIITTARTNQFRQINLHSETPLARFSILSDKHFLTIRRYQMRRGICQSHTLTARCGRLKNDLQLISVVSDDWLPTYRVCGRQTKRSENQPISRLSSLRAPTVR